MTNVHKIKRLAREPRSFDASTSYPGLVLFSTSPKQVFAYNPAAIQILAYPKDPEKLKRPESFLSRRVCSKLMHRSSAEVLQFVPEFKSGHRTYTCRELALWGTESHFVSPSLTGSIALLLERKLSIASMLTHHAWPEFRLTQRERQTIELLLQGLTTKEIAHSMNLNPNTIKVFLRLIMAKMKVSTRAGIIGRILKAERVHPKPPTHSTR